MYQPPSKETAAIMNQLRLARHARDLNWRAVATIMESDYGYRITEDQYRAAEQAITKKVTLDFLITACRALDLDPADVISNGLKASEE